MDFRILGPMEASDAGTSVELPGGRGRALLGVLLLRAGEVVSVDRLIDHLWGESPPPTVETALQGLVSKLRRLLEPGRQRGEPPRILLTRPPGYLLAVEPAQIDANRFRRMVADAENAGPLHAAQTLREALDLWRGPALADFTYEPFAQAGIAALEQLRLTALEKRIEADLALGRHRELIGELEALVAEHPFGERLRAHLMLALYRSGRQAVALDVYSDLRHALAEELGLDPAPSLQRLEALILRHDPSLDPEEQAVHELRKERRIVTVLAMDVTITAPGGDEADPEAARHVLERVYREGSTVVVGHGGSVAKMLASALVGFFGVPSAQEDDAIRAVRAAVDLRHLVTALGRELSPHVALSPSIGIDTGEVVVGDNIEDTVGGSVRTAGLLQRAAGQGRILMGEATRLLLRRTALVQAVETVAGYRRPAWRVVDLAPTAEIPSAETPIVGRGHELDQLLEGYRRVLADDSPHRITLVGDPGVGKSRLAQELASRLSAEALVFTVRCPSAGEGVTFWPLREIVNDAAGGVDAKAVDDLLDGVEDREPIIEHVLGAIGSGPSVTGSSSPLPMLGRFFEALARSGPLVLILEDLHWGQPTFLDLVEYLTEQDGFPLLLLCLGRPELLAERPGWEEGSLPLAPLGPEEARALAASRLSGRMVPAKVVDELVSTAQGNPLFVEQLAAAVGEQGELTLPPTVEALLAARIDRLGPAERDLVRVASVLGHRVSEDALEWLLPAPAGARASEHLRTLERKEFVVGSPSGFAFRHGLVQQAAYRSITKENRAVLHERAAAWMTARPEVFDDAVGYHLEQACNYHREIGDPERKAEELALRAGERLAAAGLRAFGRFDAGGAENLLARARRLLPAGHRDEWEVAFRLTEAHETMGRHEQAAAVLADLATMAPDDAKRFALELEGAWLRLAIGPDPVTMDDIAGLARSALTRYEHDDDKVVLPLFILGEVHRRSGQVADMEDLMRRALTHADRSSSARYQLGARRMLATALEVGLVPVGQCIDECERLLMWRGRENGVVLPILARLHAMNDEFDRGREMIARAENLLREGTRARRPLSLVWKRHAEVEMLAGDLDAAAGWLRQAFELDVAMGLREEASEAAALLARVLFQMRPVDECAEMAERARSLAPVESIGTQALWRSTLATSLAARGRLDEAVSLGEEAIALLPDAMVDLRGDVQADLARALLAAGQHERARAALDAAVGRYELKGNVAACRQTNLLVGTDPAPEPP